MHLVMNFNTGFIIDHGRTLQGFNSNNASLKHATEQVELWTVQKVHAA